jgi:hypothetical protein
MKKKKSLAQRIGCVIATIIVVSLVIVDRSIRFIMHREQSVKDTQAMECVNKAHPEELLNACRTLMGNITLLESGHHDVQGDRAFIEFLASDRPWPEGMPLVLVNLSPRYLRVAKSFVEVRFDCEYGAICLWAFPSNQVGRGSLRVIDGLWIVRREDWEYEMNEMIKKGDD